MEEIIDKQKQSPFTTAIKANHTYIPGDDEVVDDMQENSQFQDWWF